MSVENILIDGVGYFIENSENAGVVAQGVFDGSAINSGMVTTTATFSGTAINSGVIVGSAVFSESTTNTGSVAVAVFEGTAINTGTVEQAEFRDTASNEGTVSLSAKFADSSTNAGTVQGDAIFADTAENLPSAIVVGVAKVAATAVNNGSSGSQEVYVPPAQGGPTDLYAAWLTDNGTGHYTADGYDKWAYQGTEVANEADYNSSVTHGGVWSVDAAVGAYATWISGSTNGHYTADGYDKWAYNHTEVANQADYDASVTHGGVWSVDQQTLFLYRADHNGRSPQEQAEWLVNQSYLNWLFYTGFGNYTNDGLDKWAYNHTELANGDDYNASVTHGGVWSVAQAAAAAAAAEAQAVIDRYNTWITNTGDGHYTADGYDVWAYNHAPVADQADYNASVAHGSVWSAAQAAAAVAAAAAAASAAAAAAAAEAQAVIDRYNTWMTNTGGGHYTTDGYDVWAYNHAPVADQNAYNAAVAAAAAAEAQAVIDRYNTWATNGDGHYTTDGYDVWAYNGTVVANKADYDASVVHSGVYTAAQAAADADAAAAAEAAAAAAVQAYRDAHDGRNEEQEAAYQQALIDAAGGG